MENWLSLREKAPTWAYTVEGSWNQIFLVRKALKAAVENPLLEQPARELLYWAWQERPLEGEFTALLVEQDSRRQFVPEGCRRLLNGLLHHLRQPGETAGIIEKKALGNEPAEAMEMASELLGNPQESLYWLGRLWDWAVRHACWTQWAQWLEKAVLPQELPGMAQLRLRLEAQARIMTGDFSGAVDLAQDLDSDIFGHWRQYLLSEWLFRTGDKSAARRDLYDLWKRMPWHTNLTLKLHDLWESGPPLQTEPSDDVAVCLYTWNKAELLSATLDDLAQSRLGQAKIFALDNGSSDETPQVLEQARQCMGAERFKIIRLPVNIGAPPARNWLLSLPEVQTCRQVAFLDDDVRLPADWLQRLSATAACFPDAGAVGCRVLYVDPPQALQMVDVHLLPALQRERLPLLSNCLGEPDMGLHCYCRPAASVTGCCHLLSRKGLDAVGGFDVRYNPSQFDDLERDLRLCLAHLPAIYAGQLAVAHHRKSGPGSSMSGKAGANALGNRIKLDTAFNDAKAKELLEFNLACAWDDLMEKARRLEEMNLSDS